MLAGCWPRYVKWWSIDLVSQGSGFRFPAWVFFRSVGNRQSLEKGLKAKQCYNGRYRQYCQYDKAAGFSMAKLQSPFKLQIEMRLFRLKNQSIGNVIWTILHVKESRLKSHFLLTNFSTEFNGEYILCMYLRSWIKSFCGIRQYVYVNLIGNQPQRTFLRKTTKILFCNFN